MAKAKNPTITPLSEREAYERDRRRRQQEKYWSDRDDWLSGKTPFQQDYAATLYAPTPPKPQAKKAAKRRQPRLSQQRLDQALTQLYGSASAAIDITPKKVEADLAKTYKDNGWGEVPSRRTINRRIGRCKN